MPVIYSWWKFHPWKEFLFEGFNEGFIDFEDSNIGLLLLDATKSPGSGTGQDDILTLTDLFNFGCVETTGSNYERKLLSNKSVFIGASDKVMFSADPVVYSQHDTGFSDFSYGVLYADLGGTEGSRYAIQFLDTTTTPSYPLGNIGGDLTIDFLMTPIRD